MSDSLDADTTPRVSMTLEKRPSAGNDVPEPNDASEATVKSTGKAILLIATVTLAMMQNTANATTAGIALPRIGQALNIPETELQWIVSAYSLSSGCLLIFFGRLADLYGRKRAFLAGTLFATVFGLGCGFANDALTINILRGLQGVGSAANIPASLGILAHAFPPSRLRSVAFATFSAGAPIGAAFGMTIGGVLTQLTKPGWRSTFFFSAAMGLVCLAGGILSIPADPPLKAAKLTANEVADRRVDWLGAFLVTAGLVFVVFVLSDGETAPNGWKTGYIIALLIVGVLLIAAFLYWQTILEKHQVARKAGREIPRWAAPPLVRPGLWTRAHGKLAGMMAVAFTNWCCFLAWQFWAQLYYQQYLGLSPILTMVRMLPMFVTGVAANAVIALVVAKVDVVILTVVGTLCTGCATLFFALIDTNASYWPYGFPAAILSVVGADFVFACGTLFVAKVSLADEQSVAGGLFLTMTQLGTSFGLTISTIVFDRVQANKLKETMGNILESSLAGFRAAQWSAFAFGMLATLVAVLFLRGVGVVGHTAPSPSDIVEDAESVVGRVTDPEKTTSEVRATNMNGGHAPTPATDA